MRARDAPSLAFLLLGALIFLAPAPDGLSPAVMHAAGLVVITVGLWATQALPEQVTGLMFLLSAVLIAVAPASVVFSGFTSATLWLVLGGLVIAEAVRATALGEYLAMRLLGRFLDSYPKLVAATVLVSTLLCFVMPATVGRVLLLVPIVAGLARRIGFAPGSSGYTGLMLAAMVGTFQIGTGVLPANAPNLALAGAAESLYGVHLIYAEYLLVQFPVLGLIKMALIIAVTCRLFPARIDIRVLPDKLEPMSTEQRRLAFILAIALALWASDFLHGVRPGWVALGAGLIVILPRIGVMPPSALNDSIKYGPYFYIGSVLGLGAVVAHTGLSATLGALVLPALQLEPGADFRNFMLLALGATTACLLTTNPAQPGLMAPLAQQMADATGWPLNAALMIAAVGYSNIILPYAIPPLVVGLHVAGVGFRDATGYTLAIAAPTLLVLVPLDFLWWRTIGYLG